MERVRCNKRILPTNTAASRLMFELAKLFCSEMIELVVFSIFIFIFTLMDVMEGLKSPTFTLFVNFKSLSGMCWVLVVDLEVDLVLCEANERTETFSSSLFCNECECFKSSSSSCKLEHAICLAIDVACWMDETLTETGLRESLVGGLKYEDCVVF